MADTTRAEEDNGRGTMASPGELWDVGCDREI